MINKEINTKENEESKETIETIDAIIHVKIAMDKLTASIIIESPEDGGADPTLNHLREALSEKKVVYGIDTEKLIELSEQPIYNQEILVARGLPAEAEKDAFLEYHFNIIKDLKPKINENGTVDYRNMGIVENISEGQLLCTKTPVKGGKEGKTVLGTTLKPKKGKDIPLPMGKNTKASDNNLELFSTISGQVDYVKNKIHVLDIFTVQGDVGPKTGNIDFIGNVNIFGNVLSGYSVAANGNININGIVEGAHIKAEGSITICKGVNGMGKGILESGENINCNYMENCTAVAGGSISSSAIMNCQVKCAESLELIGKRGMLIGGTSIVGQDVLAKNIGSDAYIATVIELGKDTELFEQHKIIEEKVHKLKKEVNDLDRIIMYLQQLQSSGQITPDKLKVLNDAVNTRSIAVKDLLTANIEFSNIDQLLTQRANGKVVCTDCLYPGTTISIGMTTKTINTEFMNIVISKKDGEIALSSADALSD